MAYGVQRRAPLDESHTYELVGMSRPKKGSPWSRTEEDTIKKEVEAKTEKRPQKRETKKRKYFCFNIFVTIIAVTALLLVLIFLGLFLTHYISYQPLETQQSAVIENLQSLLNTSNEQLQLQRSELKEAQHYIYIIAFYSESSTATE